MLAAASAAAAFLPGLAEIAARLTALQKWRAILLYAFQAFLEGRPPRRQTTVQCAESAF